MPFLTRLHVTIGPRDRFWRLTAPLVFADEGWHVYMVPEGTVTDLASIPRVFRPIIPGNGRDREAAVLHDRCYETLGCIERILNPYDLPETEPNIIDAIRHGRIDVGIDELSRAESDALFYRALRESGKGWFAANAMYQAVRLGGWIAWNNHANAT